jgi:L-threonylcarbamoyladenylate synthase
MPVRLSAPGLRAHLRAGGLLAYPTESCFGLGCDPSNRRAVLRLLALKQRPARKGLILIADRAARFRPYVQAAALQAVGRQPGWPGPLTWVLPQSRRCPPWLTGRHRSLAVRVTAFLPAARLCRVAGMPLVSTSANRSGAKPLRTARECRRMFGAAVRVIDGRIGGARRPSRLVDFATGRVIRE